MRPSRAKARAKGSHLMAPVALTGICYADQMLADFLAAIAKVMK